MCNVINTMAIARSNELEFQRLLGHHLVWGEGQHAKHILIRYFG
jgi:hypothetical protein